MLFRTVATLVLAGTLLGACGKSDKADDRRPWTENQIRNVAREEIANDKKANAKPPVAKPVVRRPSKPVVNAPVEQREPEKCVHPAFPFPCFK